MDLVDECESFYKPMRALCFILACLAAPSSAQEWIPQSVTPIEGEVGSSGFVRLDLEAGELVEIALEVSEAALLVRIVDLEGIVQGGSAPRSQSTMDIFVAPDNGTFVITVSTQSGTGEFTGTVSSYGVGVLEETSGTLCAGVACSARHDFGFADGPWTGTEWFNVVVDVDADEPLDLEVVRFERDTLRASGLNPSVGPFFYSGEIELKDGPIEVGVRRRVEDAGEVDYRVRVWRWRFQGTESEMPTPPPPPGRSDGGS